MEQTKWFDRKFDFGNNQNIFPSIIDRLRGTPGRLEEKTNAISEDHGNAKSNDSWSIKENIGHLIDLELLWMNRLEDILKGKKELRPVDLVNPETPKANHNLISVNNLVAEFRFVRTESIKKIEALSEEQIFMSSIHPRLQIPMRTMDHFLFVADHDDHHLVTIHNLIHNREVLLKVQRQLSRKIL